MWLPPMAMRACTRLPPRLPSALLNTYSLTMVPPLALSGVTEGACLSTWIQALDLQVSVPLRMAVQTTCLVWRTIEVLAFEMALGTLKATVIGLITSLSAAPTCPARACQSVLVILQRPPLSSLQAESAVVPSLANHQSRTCVPGWRVLVPEVTKKTSSRPKSK